MAGPLFCCLRGGFPLLLSPFLLPFLRPFLLTCVRFPPFGDGAGAGWGDGRLDFRISFSWLYLILRGVFNFVCLCVLLVLMIVFPTTTCHICY